MPGGPDVGGGRGRFGADRVGGIVVAGQFPPGADRRGSFLPLSRPAGWAGTGPSAAVAQGGGWLAACSPIRSVRASISAAISAT